MEKLEWCMGLSKVNNFEDMCNRLYTIPACDRQTDTDILPRHSPRYAHALRGKKIVYNLSFDVGINAVVVKSS